MVDIYTDEQSLIEWCLPNAPKKSISRDYEVNMKTFAKVMWITMPSRRGRPPKSKKNSPIIDGAKFIKRFQPKLIYDQRGLLYQDLPIGCVRTLKGGRLYQEILQEKNVWMSDKSWEPGIYPYIN